MGSDGGRDVGKTIGITAASVVGVGLVTAGMIVKAVEWFTKPKELPPPPQRKPIANSPLPDEVRERQPAPRRTRPEPAGATEKLTIAGPRRGPIFIPKPMPEPAVDFKRPHPKMHPKIR